MANVAQQEMLMPWKKDNNPSLCIYLFGYGYYAWVSSEKVRDYKVVCDYTNRNLKINGNAHKKTIVRT